MLILGFFVAGALGLAGALVAVGLAALGLAGAFAAGLAATGFTAFGLAAAFGLAVIAAALVTGTLTFTVSAGASTLNGIGVVAAGYKVLFQLLQVLLLVLMIRNRIDFLEI